MTGCKNILKQPAVNGEGMIVYKITYPEDNPFKNKMGMPHQTKLMFKGTKASFITSGMGIINVINVLDNDNKKFTSMLVNALGKNYAFIETPEDVKLQETIPQYQIETTSEKKTIAGLECNKAVVNDLTNKKKFDIYYYDKIKVYLGDSPYKDFNYLLMEYQDTRYGLPMKLEAKKVKGLFFGGECVDVTGWLGGYNFQWAWATGFVIARNI